MRNATERQREIEIEREAMFGMIWRVFGRGSVWSLYIGAL